jgi:general secretion pathway protein B
MTAMHQSHFGLAAAPFSIAPDPRYLYMSQRHQEDAPGAPLPPAARIAPAVAVAASRAALPASVLASPARAAIVNANQSAGKARSGEAPQAGSISSSALAASIRKQLPPLSVAVHAYSNISQDRFVGINGRMLREGDILAPDLRLEQITPGGMIFTYRGYRFQRAAQ